MWAGLPVPLHTPVLVCGMVSLPLLFINFRCSQCGIDYLATLLYFYTPYTHTCGLSSHAVLSSSCAPCILTCGLVSPSFLSMYSLFNSRLDSPTCTHFSLAGAKLHVSIFSLLYSNPEKKSRIGKEIVRIAFSVVICLSLALVREGHSCSSLQHRCRFTLKTA
jgi:hypothetical protein